MKRQMDWVQAKEALRFFQVWIAVYIQHFWVMQTQQLGLKSNTKGKESSRVFPLKIALTSSKYNPVKTAMLVYLKKL